MKSSERCQLGSRRGYSQDRTRSTPHNPLGNAAAHRVNDPMPTLCRHDNEIHILSRIENRHRHLTLCSYFSPGACLALGTLKIRQHAAAIDVQDNHVNRVLAEYLGGSDCAHNCLLWIRMMIDGQQNSTQLN